MRASVMSDHLMSLCHHSSQFDSEAEALTVAFAACHVVSVLAEYDCDDRIDQSARSARSARPSQSTEPVQSARPSTSSARRAAEIIEETLLVLRAYRHQTNSVLHLFRHHLTTYSHYHQQQLLLAVFDQMQQEGEGWLEWERDLEQWLAHSDQVSNLFSRLNRYALWKAR